MTDSAPRALRCAIYTRKSTDEGLERDFNSLDAQRESAEAYVLSQRQAGWLVLPEHYDDGGFSGASMDRPALRNLLMLVEARAIDCVLVYKVDRLSPSLLDFARLMELFERCGVSFVSVTQDFNSTTSLGRLTLHILLSFAQFEREIISERTRDKLSAARRKGKWIGGFPVLGYDVAPEGRRLVVNEKEAEQVREIFRVCRETGTLEATVRAVAERGFTTKAWTAAGSGQHHPAQPLKRSTLRLLLSNVLYTGSVSHKGTVYPGEQEAIIDPEVWTAVSAKLQTNSAHLRGRQHQRQETLLENLLRCGECQGPMIASRTNRKGHPFTYYVCAASRGLRRVAKCPARPVSAGDLEDSLRRHLEPVVGSQISRPVLERSVERISWASSTRRVAVTVRDGTAVEYVLAWPIRRGVRGQVYSGPGARLAKVARTLALAIKLKRLVSEGVTGNYKEVARLGHISGARMSQIMGLTELSPGIQEELLFLPATLLGPDRIHENELRQIARVVDWEEQRRLFRSLMDKAAKGRH